ncbi:aspartyl protease, partial [Anoxybacillus sp. J5B_2022]|nr:aspartyl protease [Anoxybacillus sp. J5B_2022]
MQIEYRDGLLFTSIEIVYRGKTKRIDNMVIDTGAAKTLISQHAVE